MRQRTTETTEADRQAEVKEIALDSKMSSYSSNNNQSALYRAIFKQPKELTLMEKIENYYATGKSSTGRMANRLAMTIFWFCAISTFYVVMAYIIPFCYGFYADWICYALKVLTVFIFIQCLGNWACCHFTGTFYEETLDRPHVDKLLWDDTKVFLDGVERKRETWPYCNTCNHRMPPRVHHCKICDKCIRKRDHHCYVTGVCIGYFNQRYFVFLNFYSAVATLIAFPHEVYYIYHTFYPASALTDFILPVAVFKWITGEMLGHHCVLVIHLYILWWAALVATGFFIWHMYIISIGKTSNEVTSGKRLKVTSGTKQNFRSVFGDFWPFNFILPAQLVFRQTGDGTEWPKVKFFDDKFTAGSH
ncbi:unnamed protein product [Owenia fusiformis]|uniref:Palmitoyltransferase n=1 Tax=Owenia fusiformis TaxID=6347 RepID=A0A8J1Y023_OWEFU|nr:unnamed protein product [Owenia fusiformis]